MPNLSKISFVLSMALMVTFATVKANAQEYEPWTGTVTGATIHLGSHDTLSNIRRMINAGRTAEAVLESKKFIASLNTNTRSGVTHRYLYDGYNALCISHTAHKEFDEALKACDQAIEHTPARWQAYNSRGSLNYKTGNFANALNDYRSALENAPDATHIRRIIEHNIRISEARVTEN
ncbi:tetratricopeptide repeat protein [Pseudemcibacter aquimaris]|uniref:tetratricopeptide repeat protein n=1 Tax=Pseudemcibacter aquimaris TaxID=2857064 RepID=UPI002013AC73|nr:tetratricopeptide repeat protein [Pseudemcibacter aquimaris]MCC3862151.1 tetratricopeptide repeat protein [Pseudemcibacter aquimaris]WDU58904.1 tetratricopeptide repeat protein [Pseudemcibacter aquimaris]